MGRLYLARFELGLGDGFIGGVVGGQGRGRVSVYLRFWLFEGGFGLGGAGFWAFI